VVIAALKASSSDALWDVLRGVPDPEIPVVSIVDLGIVREADGDRVVLTPTYTGCPATHVIEAMVREALDAAGYRKVRIETTLSPPWTTDWITPKGREQLRAYGIAPPTPAGSRAVTARNATPPTPRDQPLRLHPLQGAVALPRVRRAVRPFQMPLTANSAPAKAGAVDDGAAQQGSGLRRST
jgi:ring-1,2-phenylacetyl-CoA epoxidase subunit PaaD